LHAQGRRWFQYSLRSRAWRHHCDKLPTDPDVRHTDTLLLPVHTGTLFRHTTPARHRIYELLWLHFARLPTSAVPAYVPLQLQYGTMHSQVRFDANTRSSCVFYDQRLRSARFCGKHLHVHTAAANMWCKPGHGHHSTQCTVPSSGCRMCQHPDAVLGSMPIHGLWTLRSVLAHMLMQQSDRPDDPSASVQDQAMWHRSTGVRPERCDVGVHQCRDPGY
jgi:hypothetical protein